mgnify:CR=1 FL=1
MLLNYLLMIVLIISIFYVSHKNFKNKTNIFFEDFKNAIVKIFEKNNNFRIIKLKYIDTQNILKFLKNKFKYDNILIPKDVTYKIEDKNKFIFENIEIVGINYKNNQRIITKKNISFKFTPINNNTFISNQDLFGINGHFHLIKKNKDKEKNDLLNIAETIPQNISENIPENNPKNIPQNILQNDYSVKDSEMNSVDTENILNIVPDIIHLTSESEVEIDSIQETTEDINHPFA